MSNKNAYEIRLDVLHLAHSDLFSKYDRKIDALYRAADRKNEAVDPRMIDTLYPTPASILERADELYAFVEGK